jgi:hypothetical protein
MSSVFIETSDSRYLQCPVPEQQNTVVSDEGVPAVIRFTLRDRSGSPVDLSRWFRKKCVTLPGEPALLPEVKTKTPFEDNGPAPLTPVAVDNDPCSGC